MDEDLVAKEDELVADTKSAKTKLSRLVKNMATLDDLIDHYEDKESDWERFVAETKAKGEREPPSARLIRISNDGQLFLTFSKEMVFPEGFKDRLNHRNEIDVTESIETTAAAAATPEDDDDRSLSEVTTD